jgi:hypothetical protein
VSQTAAVRQIGQRLNDGKRSGRTTRLARLMGTSVATVQSWGAAGESKARKRRMSPTARRLLFLLLALHERGEDLEALRRQARQLEQIYLQVDDD